MASALVAIIVILIIVAILVFLGWLSFGFNIAIGQTIAPPVSPSTALPTGTPPQPTPPAVVQPTPVPTAAPTATNPNFQYLPQKAYVQSFAPEQGVPNSTPLQAAPVVVAPTTATAPQAPFDIMAILATVGAAGAYLKGHLANKKAVNTETLTKTTMAGTLTSKEQIAELARVVFEFNKEQADKLQNAPSIKLETLKQDKEDFANKTAEA